MSVWFLGGEADEFGHEKGEENERGRDEMAEDIEKEGRREGPTWCHICP